jgi:hypothetical protein
VGKAQFSTVEYMITWATHVAGMGEMRNVYIILIGILFKSSCLEDQEGDEMITLRCLLKK